VVRGLAALLFQGRAASPSFYPFAAGNACRRCLSSRHRHHPSARTPPWSIESRWRAMRACQDSPEGQPKVTTAMRVSGTLQARCTSQGRSSEEALAQLQVAISIQ
jgi:hypothetical protein